MDRMIIGSDGIIDLGGIRDSKRIAIQTVQKWDVPNARPLPRNPEAMAAALRHHRESGHICLELRSLASEYNCVGLVFGSRRTEIAIDYVTRIFREDGYRQIKKEQAQRGDVVLYADTNGPAHVGLLWAKQELWNDWMVLSQWGADGEYFHHVNDVPINDWLTEVTIWTERRETR